MENKTNLNGLEKISSISLDFEMEKKTMKKSTATYVATKDGVTTSEFYSVEKPSKRQFKKFNEAFVAELNREELFIGALGLALLDETDEASKLNYTDENVTNIYGREVRKIRTYSDGSVQVFQVKGIKTHRHYYNGAIYTFKTVQFTTGDNFTSSEETPSQNASKRGLGYQIASLRSAKELVNQVAKAKRIATLKNANFMANHELQLQAMRF